MPICERLCRPTQFFRWGWKRSGLQTSKSVLIYVVKDSQKRKYYFDFCCRLYSITAVCLEQEFTCADGTCIGKSLICDLYPDCPDFSDEFEDLCCRKYTPTSTKFTPLYSRINCNKLYGVTAHMSGCLHVRSYCIDYTDLCLDIPRGRWRGWKQWHLASQMLLVWVLAW